MNKYIIFLIVLVGFLLYYYIFMKKSNSAPQNSYQYSDDLDYQVQEIPNFLTPEECDTIIKLTDGKLFKSKVYGEDSDLSSDTRVSQQCWLHDNIHPVVKNISDKVRRVTDTHDNYQEEMQVVNYPPGGFFLPHYDACDGDKQFCERLDSKHGPRYMTVLFYLNDDFQGGETVFPNINKTVRPEKGKAVIFKNVNKDNVIIKQAFHGGQPVIAGEKWIANKWIKVNNM